jgi:hypothetical protein
LEDLFDIKAGNFELTVAESKSFEESPTWAKTVKTSTIFSRSNSVNKQQLLRVVGREHPELALSCNAVRCKICVINGKYCRKKFTPRQIHERAIGKIHGSIPIARHQTMHVLQFPMVDCTGDQCSGMNEPPGGLHLRACIANQEE